MKIIKKDGLDRIKITHNRGLFWFIIFLIIFFIGFLVYANKNFENETKDVDVKECNSNSDCVPEICCHAASCVAAERAPNCENMLCTMECAPGTMDCGQGRCGCVNGRCGVVLGVINEKYP